MGFTPKNWIDEADHAGPPASPPGTPFSAAAMEDLEVRVTDHADTRTEGIYNVKDFGATGDGSTDDAAEIQDAIDACAAGTGGGGIVYFPPGTYMVGTPLNCNAASGMRITGAGPGLNVGATPSKLVYTGTVTGASGGLMYFHGVSGWELDHLEFSYNNAGFEGDLITIDGRATVYADVQDFHIHHCTSGGTGGAPARSIFRLAYAIIGRITHCHLTSADYCVLLGEPAEAFIVGMTVSDCTFNWSNIGHIGIGSGDAENIIIERNVFEAGTSTPGIKGITGHAIYTIDIRDNWFGDAGAATTWIDGLVTSGNNRRGVIQGNRMAHTVGGYHFNISGAWYVIGNDCEGGWIFKESGGLYELVVMGNTFNTGSAIFENDVDWIVSYIALANRCPDTGKLYDYHGAQGSFGRYGTGSSMAAGDKTGGIYIGSDTHDAGAYRDIGNRAAVYMDYTAYNVHHLILQGPSDSDNTNARQVKIVVGSSRSEVIAAGMNNDSTPAPTLGFYGATAVKKPTALTTADASTVDGTYGAEEAAVITNLRTRVGELESKLQSLGLLS